MTHELMLIAVFVVAAGASFGASSILISRLEAVGFRIGLTEAALGLLAAFAADAPEIASSISAVASGQHIVGLGVILGANIFQLAALLGLSAIVAGKVIVARRVVLFEGVPAVAIAAIALLMVTGFVSPLLAMILALLVFIPYVWFSATSPTRRAKVAPHSALVIDSSEAVADEEADLDRVIGEVRTRRSDAPVAIVTLVVVIAASVALERSATALGSRWGVSPLVVGAVVIAIVTSIPNVVAALHLARRGRGAAAMSEAMNSNRINTLAGLLVPALFVGAGYAATIDSASRTLAVVYAGLTLLVVAWTWWRTGMRRIDGYVLCAAYVALISVLMYAL